MSSTIQYRSELEFMASMTLHRDVQAHTIWDKLLYQLVDLLWLLTLASAFAVDNITANTPSYAWRIRAFFANKAHLLGMLQVVPVRFGHPPVDCHLYPHYLIHQSAIQLKTTSVIAGLAWQQDHCQQYLPSTLTSNEGQMTACHSC